MVDTAYSNPGGTGDRTADITVTSTLFTGGDPNDLVNGNTVETGLQMSAGAYNAYIKFDFGSGADPVIDAFRMYVRTHVHSASAGYWYFEGSDDDSTWFNLSAAGPGGGFLMTFGEEFAVACIEYTGFQNTTGYRYVRMLQVKSVVPPSQPEIIEVEFRINSSESSPDPDPPPPPDPDYGEPGGTGDRTSLIWVSQNFSEFDGNAVRLIDGSTTADATGSFRFHEGLSQVAASIVFDFRPTGYKQRIIGFTWKQQAVEDFGLWTFEASDSSSSGWVALLTNINIGEGTAEEYLFTNPTGYKFYRLRKTDADVILTDDTWCQEIEFIIGATDAIAEPLPLYLTGDRTGLVSVTLEDADFTIQPSEAAANGAWFDGNTTGDVAWLNAGSTGRLVFEFDQPQAINEMRWYSSGSASQGYWRAYGSHDGTTWQALGAAPVRLIGTDIGNTGTFNGFAANTQAFKYYGLELQAGNSSFANYVREIEFRTIEAYVDPGDLCLSYSNDRGDGDRTADITVTLDVGTLDAGALIDLVDGVRNGTTLFADIDADADFKLRFDLGAPYNIRQATLFYQVGAIGGTALVGQWEASNDGSTWANTSAEIDMNAAVINDVGAGVFFVPMAMEFNDSEFRYYRLKRISGNGNLKFSEMEFYIAGTAAGLPKMDFLYRQSAGDRTEGAPVGITVSMSGLTLANGTIDNFVDGNATDNPTYGVNFTGGQSSGIVKFDFGSKVFIDATYVHGFTPGVDYHGTFYFEGSNDDFVSDINVVQDPWHGGNAFGDFGLQILDSPGAYRWYRARQKTGAWQNAIYVNEIRFRMFPQLSHGICAGDPPPVANPSVTFVDEGELLIVEPPVFAATFTDEGEFLADMAEPAAAFSATFVDESDFDADLTITAPPVNPVVTFTDDGLFLAREEHEPVAVVQSLIIISGR